MLTRTVLVAKGVVWSKLAIKYTNAKLARLSVILS